MKQGDKVAFQRPSDEMIRTGVFQKKVGDFLVLDTDEGEIMVEEADTHLEGDCGPDTISSKDVIAQTVRLLTVALSGVGVLDQENVAGIHRVMAGRSSLIFCTTIFVILRPLAGLTDLPSLEVRGFLNKQIAELIRLSGAV